LKKKKTIAKLVDEAAVLMQKYVRMKAADRDGYCQCVTCGIKKPWKEMQGGHFISRKWTATKLLEENIHPQCPYCNGPLRGNMIQYTLFMQDTYGREFVEELEILKHKTRKYTRAEIEEYKQELMEKIQGHEQTQ
jgi:NAD-dependent SIR2 family protein deacetylase